ncbi:MAG: ABC transporter permease [Asgard group archaeon]|nr:ABC transporter permease [Asgard group archaeon]
MEKESFWQKIKNSFRRIGGIFTGSAISWMRSGPAVFFTFIYPVIMILLFGYIFGSSGTEENFYTVYYYNEDLEISTNVTNFAQNLIDKLNSESTVQLRSSFESNEFNKTLALYNSASLNETIASYWMKLDQIPYMIYIPQGWSEAVNESITNTTIVAANIEYYYDPSYTSSFEVQSAISNVLLEMNIDLYSIPTAVIVDIGAIPGKEELSYIDFYVPGIIMVTISTSGMMGLVSTITVQKQSGLIYKLSATTINKWEWALAQEFWQVATSIAISILTVLTGWIAFDFSFSTLHWLHIPILIFGSMTFAGLALIISRFVKRPEAAMAATMSFVFPQMFLAGAVFPSFLLPDFMQIIAKFFPLYYISEAMRSVMLESTFNNVWMPLGVTIAMGIVFFVVGTLITVWRKE